MDSASCIASVRPSMILEFRVSTSWPWLLCVSLLSGPKYSSYHLCRLTGQNRLARLGYRIGYYPFMFADPLLHQQCWSSQWALLPKVQWRSSGLRHQSWRWTIEPNETARGKGWWQRRNWWWALDPNMMMVVKDAKVANNPLKSSDIVRQCCRWCWRWCLTIESNMTAICW